MKLQKVNATQTDCLLSRLLETNASQVSLYQDCEDNSPIVLVRFAVSVISQPNHTNLNLLKFGELHIISTEKLNRAMVKSVVNHFLDQVNILFYYDPSLGWEQFDGRLPN